ncbi:MAG: hypothetical protein WD077_07525 [Bacteroidia bacterium]
MSRCNTNLNFYITNQLVVNAGPALNVLVSQYQNDDGRFASRWARSPFYERSGNRTQVQMWIGWHAGLRL